MKRYIIYNICIAVLLSFISCSEGLQEIEEVGAPAELLMLSTESINAGSVKGSYKVVATSRYMPECRIEYVDQTTTDNWINCIVGSKKSYDVSIDVVVAENKTFYDRSATISVVIFDSNYGVEYSKTIAVTQSAAVPEAQNGTCEISPDAYSFNLSIKTNIPSYKISVEYNIVNGNNSTNSWLRLNKSTGSGNTYITITANANPQDSPRSANIYIIGNDNEGKFLVCEITQKAMTYTWTTSYEGVLDEDNVVEISAPWNAKEYSVQISTNLSWLSNYSIEGNEGDVGNSWFTILTKNKSLNMQTKPTATEFKFSLKENRSESNRKVSFTVYSQLNSSYFTTIVVNQAFAPALSFGGNSTGLTTRFDAADFSVKVNTVANTKWSAVSDADWLTLKTQNGVGAGNLDFSITKNDTASPREATIIVSLDDYEGAMAEYVVTQNCDNTIQYTAKSKIAINTNRDLWGDEVLEHSYDSETGKGYIEFEVAPTKVGDSVFKDCADLVAVKLPNSVVEIDSYAFYNCINLESVELAEGLTSIGYAAFHECEKLKNITIPSSVSTMGDRVFYKCTNLESVNIPEGITSIGSAMFAHCTTFTTITIPDSVTSINENAFNGCTGLTSLTIGQGVESIGAQAFLECTGLTSITIPESVTSMGPRAFGYFTGELIINSKLVETDYTEENRRGSNSHWLDLCGFTKVTFGSNVTRIGDNAFHSCSTLKSVTIPSSVTSIGQNAFANCYRLEYINVPNSVTSIGKYAFEECTGRLEMNSREIIEKEYEYEYDSDAAESSYNNYWIKKSRFSEIVLGGNITKIGRYAFHKCEGIEEVVIPNGVASIGDDAFYGCSGMKYLSIPNSIASIGQYAFHGCTGELVVNCNIPASKYSAEGAFFYSKFTSVTIGDSVTTIGDYAFYNNSAMTTVTIGRNITSIGQYAFSNCSALTRVDISDMRAWLNIDFANATANPINYAKNLYLNGSLVESVTIPSDMTEVKPYTFVHSTSLKSVILHSGITSIGKYAFRGCVKLSNITIPDRVTLIGERAFYDCESFTSVTIPASVTSIEIYAFYGCGALESVYCKPTTPPTGSSSMFYGNASNRKIYVPKNSVDAYKSAEYWNTYKNYIEGYNF